ncbi:hypothetical protein D3C74_381400 [compost metagenome]
MDGSDDTNLSTGYNLLHTSVLGMISIHNRFCKKNTMLLTRLNHFCRFISIQGSWFLTQHVFASLCRFDGPFFVHMVRQRNIDGFNVRISDELFITAIRSGNVKFFGKGLRLFFAAAGNRQHLTAFGLLDRRNDCIFGNG